MRTLKRARSAQLERDTDASLVRPDSLIREATSVNEASGFCLTQISKMVLKVRPRARARSTLLASERAPDRVRG